MAADKRGNPYMGTPLGIVRLTLRESVLDFKHFVASRQVPPGAFHKTNLLSWFSRVAEALPFEMPPQGSRRVIAK